MVDDDAMKANTHININMITQLELEVVTRLSFATTKVDITWTAVVSIAGVVVRLLAGAREARVLGRRGVTDSLPGLKTLCTAQTAP